MDNQTANQIQPELNIGMLGHVSHGKSTLVNALTGTKTQRHSKEQVKGITIKLGYANAHFYLCQSTGIATTNPELVDVTSPTVQSRYVSFVDCPGHEKLMRTALSGSSVIDGAILIISANEPCPQPQTLEHLIALDAIMRVKSMHNIIIIQNKIDLVSVDIARKNKREIEEFVKGTVAQSKPIIPISAQFETNIDQVIKQIMKFQPNRGNTTNNDLRMNILRSFDINKPGTRMTRLKGGVLGGSILNGNIRVGDQVVISPGIIYNQTDSEQNQTVRNTPITTRIISIHTEKTSLNEAHHGGLISLETTIDPGLTMNDRMVGNIITKTPVPTPYELDINCNWIKDIGKKIEIGSELYLNIYSIATVCTVTEKLSRRHLKLKLKYPVVCGYTDLIFISIKTNNKYELSGVGYLSQTLTKLQTANVDVESNKPCDQINSVHDFDYDTLVLNCKEKQKNTNESIYLPKMELEKEHKKIIWANFGDFCHKLNLKIEHFKSYIEIEMGLKSNECSITKESKLKIKKIVYRKNLEKLVKKYIKEFVMCRACSSAKTEMNGKNISCTTCKYSRKI